MGKTQVINFKFGSLIRTGPALKYGGKWHAVLDEDKRSEVRNAQLTIHINIYFQKIDPAGGADSGTHADANDEPGKPSKKKIQKWADGEFEGFTTRLVSEAQAYWDRKFWLETPKPYHGLDFPDDSPRYRCNIFCRFKLKQAYAAKDAHYTIAVVRAQDGQRRFRSHSVLYSQEDLDPQTLIPNSTKKFWTHYHEIGHLIGLGHVGSGNKRSVHNNNHDSAYGVTEWQMEDVMGKGHVRRAWHALPWQEAAQEFTGIKRDRWKVSQVRIKPEPL